MDIRKLLAETIAPRRGQAWHGGPTPTGTLRGVSAAEARWRPRAGRHTIWELTLHIAYWDYAVRRRLLGGAMGEFPRHPANWPAMPSPAGEREWAADRALLAREHRLLAEAIRRFPATRRGRRAQGRKRWTYGDLIAGIAMHDAYHAGQLQLMKRLWAAR
jgi:hypothetical protein